MILTKPVYSPGLEDLSQTACHIVQAIIRELAVSVVIKKAELELVKSAVCDALQILIDLKDYSETAVSCVAQLTAELGHCARQVSQSVSQSVSHSVSHSVSQSLSQSVTQSFVSQSVLTPYYFST